MGQYLCTVKDKKIRIFRDYEQNSEAVKDYVHAKDTKLNAFIRQLSANEKVTNGATTEENLIEVIINARPIKSDMLIEWRDKTYQIMAVDRFDFSNTEIKIVAREVSTKAYDLVLWEGLL